MPISINGSTGISGLDGSASAPVITGTDSNTGLSFGTDIVNINTGGTTRATINSSGNIGIGTPSPAKSLDINTASATFRIRNASGGNDFAFKTTAGPVSVVGCEANTTLAFMTNDTQAMQIDTGGKVQINTTSSQGGHILSIKHDSAASLVLRRDTSSGGVANFMFGSSFVGSIQVLSGATQYVTSSDYRLKENATAISDAITRLKTLKPYRFNWKADKSKTVDGFFAHEVTAVPEAITGTKDEVDENNEPIYQGIDQSKLVPLLTAALQEAVGKIETLETKVAALEAK